MSRKPPKNNKKLDQFVQRQRVTRSTLLVSQPSEQNCLNTRSPKPKRIVNLNQFFKKHQQTAESKRQQTLTLQSCLSQVDLNEIMAHSKPLDVWVKNILQKNCKVKDRLLIVIQRCFKLIPNLLWSNKYQPKTLSQLFDRKIADKISLWIRSFTRYRNRQLFEQSNSFIDDLDYDDEGSESLFLLIRQNNWKCKALVLKGRANIGKTSLIRVVSKSLNYAIHECSVDLNQQKYLKENNQSTKSENISVIPRNNKIDLTNHNINRYFPNLQQSKSQKQQRNALHFIRDVNCVYPQKNRYKFCKHLTESIDCSKVPFVLSTISSTLPQEYSKYDFIELEQPSVDKLAEFFWVINFVEKCLGSKLNQRIKIKRQELWEELNNQLGQGIPSQSDISFQQMKDIVQMFHSNLSAIFNFLQFHHIKDLYTESALFTQRITSQNLLCSFFDAEYLLKRQKSTLTSIKDPQLHGESTPQAIHLHKTRRDLKSKIRQLDLLRLADFSKDKQIFEGFNYQKMFSKQREQKIQDNLLMNIPFTEHYKAKQQICQALRGQCERKMFIEENHLSSLRANQLCYVPMIVTTRKSRKVQITFQETLNKFIDDKKVRYLLQFTRFHNQEFDK